MHNRKKSKERRRTWWQREGTVPRVAVPEEDVVEVDVVRTANLKENWDLKRDVEKKLKRLERRTQQAMVELMREEEIGRQKSQLQQ